MRIRLVLSIMALGVLTACQAVVTDPVGDAQDPNGNYIPGADIVEAGVNYQHASTTLWMRFAAPPTLWVENWIVSVDGTTTGDYSVVLGPDTDHYQVRSASAEVTCAGYVSNDGRVGDKIELTLDSRCFTPYGGAPLPGTLRIKASILLPDAGGSDGTDWTGSAPIS